MTKSSRNYRQIILFTVISIILLSLGYKAIRLGSILYNIRTHGTNLLALRQASSKSLFESQVLKSVSKDLDALNVALGNLQQAAQTELWLLSHLGWVPSFGGDLAVAPVLLDAGFEFSAAGKAITNASLPFAELEAQLSLSNRALENDPKIQAAWNQVQPDLQKASNHLERALTALETLDTLPDAQHLDPYLNRYLDRIRPFLPFARLGTEILSEEPAVIEAFLGLAGARNYLVILQNPWEMRPTGGFISAAVVLTVAGGSFEMGSFIDSWNVDAHPEELPAPPLSLHRAMWAGKINFLNANWSADMPTSADWAAKLYEIGQGTRIDGVIAFDPFVIQNMLNVTGPVNIPDLQTSVSADNLWDQLVRFHDNPLNIAEDASRGEILARRKDFLPIIAGPLMEKLLSSIKKPDQLVEIAQVLLQALDERHLMVTSRENKTAAWLNSKAWDGAIWQGSGDYLQVVDANVGFNKVNARVEKEITYQVELKSDGGAAARVEIAYHNRSLLDDSETCVQELPEGIYAEEWINGCYWTYTRLYVPAGSKLTSASPDHWPPHSLWKQMNPTASDPGVLIGPPESGRQVFGILFAIPPGESTTVHFNYSIPAGVWNAKDGYQLFLQKQSGTISIPHQVTIRFPEGIVALETDSEVMKSGIMANFLLSKDESMTIRLGGEVVDRLAAAPTNTPPQIISTPEPTATHTPIPTFTTGPTPTPIVLLVTATPSSIPQSQGLLPVTTIEASIGEKATWNNVRIPAIGADSIVVQVGWKVVGPPNAKRAEWEVAAFAAGHHKDSAYPGETGNVVLSGHHNILGEVFRNLWELEPGDDIFLSDSQKKVYHYITREVHIFLEEGASAQERASHLKYLERKPEAILTLVTCWPYESNTHRTIVIADLAGLVEDIEMP